MDSAVRTVADLYERHQGESIYVVGTGASMRVFPVDFLHDKVTIGCNQAWKLLRPTYNITIRPELNIPEFLGEPDYHDLVWIVKHEKFTTPEQHAYARQHPDRFYHFRTDGKQMVVPPDFSDAPGRMPIWAEQPHG